MKNRFYALCGLSLLLFSCQKEEAAAPADPARSIYLRAQVENTMATRAPYTLSEPNQTHPLKVAVWASTTPGEFKNLGKTGADNVVALHTTANFTNGAEQLLNDAIYPENAIVYFVGLHPEDGWTTPTEGNMAGKTASFTFKGCEDVMFAPQISGKYGENVTIWPIFQFRHLLTWLRVTVKADGEAVSDAWGRIKSLKIKSMSGVTVDDLIYDRTADRTKKIEDCFSFSNETELDFYKTGSDEVFVDKNNDQTWYTLPYDNAVEVAYVLCASVEATKDDPEDATKTTEYTLIVETESRTVEVPIDLMTTTDPPTNPPTQTNFEGNTRNRQFLLNLTFKMGNKIAVKADIADWAMGGSGSEELDPNTGNTNTI